VDGTSNALRMRKASVARGGADSVGLHLAAHAPLVHIKSLEAPHGSTFSAWGACSRGIETHTPSLRMCIKNGCGTILVWRPRVL
jgi:hypothetical protein